MTERELYEVKQILSYLPEDEYNQIPREIKMLDWQENFLTEVGATNNVILSSPTGSGKTIAFLEWAKIKGKRTIITSPIKALSNQHYRKLLGARL